MHPFFLVPGLKSSAVIRGCYNESDWSILEFVYDSGDCVALDDLPAIVAQTLTDTFGGQAVSYTILRIVDPREEQKGSRGSRYTLFREKN